MINYIILMALPLLANSSSVHDETFYSLHPSELQKAIEQCPSAHPIGITCEQLIDSAKRANVLISELHYNPQGFGQNILTLQEELAKLRSSLKTSADQIEIQASIDKNKTQLNERLAIVKWLTSPKG